MKRSSLLLIICTALAGLVVFTVRASTSNDEEAAPIYGIKIPAGYRDWKLISVARVGGQQNDLRAKLGNEVAIKAYREGKAEFPDGTIIARLAWKQTTSEENNKAGRVIAEKGSNSPVVQSLLAESFILDCRRTFNSWSKTQRNTRRRAAGALLNLPTANLTARPCTRPAFRVTSRRRIATSSSRATHPKTG